MTDSEKKELKEIYDGLKHHLIKIGGDLNQNPMTNKIERLIQSDKNFYLAFLLGQADILAKINFKLEKHFKKHNII